MNVTVKQPSAKQPPADAVRVAVDALTRFGTDALAAGGPPADDARAVAELMVEADLTGAEAHGMFRVNQTAAATALVDGDNCQIDLRRIRTYWIAH